MKELNKFDPFEEEIWDEDYKPSLRKEPEWISFDCEVSFTTGRICVTSSGVNNMHIGTSGTSGTFRILPEVRRIESTSFGKKVRRKGPQPKYKNFPVKTDSRSEFIKKDKYGR